MAKALRLWLGKAIAYLGVCISLGERPAAWTVMVWSKAQMERARRELADREATLNKMVDDAMRATGADPSQRLFRPRAVERDYTELPALTGHGRPKGLN